MLDTKEKVSFKIIKKINVTYLGEEHLGKGNKFKGSGYTYV